MTRGARIALGAVLVVGAIVRIGYVAAQPAHDPTFERPALDGAVYWAWAGRLAAGEGSPPGAYYLAPLYPLLLGGVRVLLGDAHVTIRLVQHALVLFAVWSLARVAGRAAGPVAAVATAALALGYHPLLFFASRPLSEPLAIALLAGATDLATGGAGRASGAAAGLSAGLAALARPNLLLVVPLWAAADWVAARRRRAVVLVAAAVLAILPVTVRNAVVSGHLVPVSSNAGITLYHGNAPGARGGLVATTGLSGSPLEQRAEATAVARAATGRDLDAVEADRWWGRRAVGARLDAPLDTLALVARRAALTLADTELGLDAIPSLDANPWRRAAPLPFALLVGLAAAGLVAPGVARSGGRRVWLAIGACALTPLVFYVSSRYRLPLAAMLTIPAGCGAAALIDAWRARRSIVAPLAALLVVAGLSLTVPTAGLERAQRAAGLANRAAQLLDAGDVDGALEAAQRSLDVEPGAIAQANRGAALARLGRTAEAERAWRAALALDPGHAHAAGSLAALLIRDGRPAAAIAPLRTALATRPDHEVCWTNLIVAYHDAGDATAARRTLREARARGVTLDPGLVEAVGGAAP